MAQFAIIFKEESFLDDILVIKASHYDINNGFFRFYRGDIEIASHSCDGISSCTIQYEYTEDEVLEQLERYKKVSNILNKGK